MKNEIDDVTGVETTGHTWDGDLKELNKPLPKWWLYTFYVCCIWAVGYWILYPAWPLMNDYTRGVLGYSQRAVVMEQVAEGKKAQSAMWSRLEKTELDAVASDSDLLRFANASGKAAFGENCAPCHGRGAQGAPGYPNLNDDDWLWGGTIDDIHETIQVGIRSSHDDTRESDMPKFGVDELLEGQQIDDVAEYVLSLSNLQTNAAAATRGAAIFKEQCVACHGEDGGGNQGLGAPNLKDAVWLYGSSKEAVVKTIRTGRGGIMPTWEGRLDPLTIKALAVYVHGLGGGQ